MIFGPTRLEEAKGAILAHTMRLAGRVLVALVDVVVRHLREGRPIYYLPDMDFGRNGSIFVPFFGIAARCAMLGVMAIAVLAMAEYVHHSKDEEARTMVRGGVNLLLRGQQTAARPAARLPPNR